MRPTSIRCAIALVLCAPLAAAAAGDPAKDLRSKDVALRLAAVDELAAGHVDAEKLLLRALEDDDWEVVERAARALGGCGTKAAHKALLGLALDGPIRRVRRAAAESLARLDPDESFDAIAKKTGGGDGLAACESLVPLAAALAARSGHHSLEKALRAKDEPQRAAAARALVVATAVERAELLAQLLAHAELAVRAAALEGIALLPAAADVDPLLAQLAAEPLDDVLERRARAALVALFRASDEAARASLRERLSKELASGRAHLAARLARLVGDLAARGAAPAAADGAAPEAASAPPPPLGEADALALLARALEQRDEGVRAAAAHALGRVGGAESALRAAAVGAGDASARVRLAALFAVVAATPDLAAEPGAPALAFLCARAKSDADARVREEAAAALGVRHLEAGVATLAACLADRDWGVAVCAAVSLGEVGASAGVEPLVALARSPDWRLRGAAVVGLGRARVKEAVPVLIDALEDAEPLVRRSAHEFLVAIARKRLAPDKATWAGWWAENEKRVRLIDPEEEAERRRRFGYVRSTSELYQGLDVIVLESRGDHIETVLGDLGIEHRRTEAAKVAQSEPHARAVFVANCTGEILPDDVARLQWFVRAGGYLFGSCWALEETIERVYPGVIRRLSTASEVQDDVRASACAPDSRWLAGVFDGDVQPIYALEGAYLIDVVQPERVEVLIDSPECAGRWGGGNLCAWFRVGHGVILDSVNHFEEQGLSRARDVKKPVELMAFAVDHMGLSLAELRELRGEPFWKSKSDAAKRVRDLSVLRLVSNFVREKRLAGD